MIATAIPLALSPLAIVTRGIGPMHSQAHGKENTSMEDRIFEAFLTRQYEDGMALARASDLVELFPMDDPPPRHYVAQFRCRGLVQIDGEIREGNEFAVGIYFPPDYLRCADPAQVLTWFGPPNVWHPNIADWAPLVCVGKLAPGTSLSDIIYQLYEVISYQKVTPREDDALNKAACAWVRNNAHRLPVDRRPLKRRALNIKVEQA